MYARPSPSFPGRCSTATRSGCWSARRSAIAPVPSGELSSAIKTDSSSSSGSAISASIMFSTFSASLYVGSTTMIFIPGPSPRVRGSQLAHYNAALRVGQPARIMRSACGPLFVERPEWIPRDFPQVPIRILEIARVAAPEHVLGRFDERGSGAERLLQHKVDFFPGADVVRQREPGLARRRLGSACFPRKTGARHNCQLESATQFEECDSANLGIPPDDPFGWQPQPVTIERDRALDIVHTQRDHGNARFHMLPLWRLSYVIPLYHRLAHLF